jgi:hypothetical protein
MPTKPKPQKVPQMTVTNVQTDQATGKVFVTYSNGQQREFNSKDELKALGQNEQDQPQSAEDIGLGLIVADALKSDPTFADPTVLKGVSVTGQFTVSETTKLP